MASRVFCVGRVLGCRYEFQCDVINVAISLKKKFEKETSNAED
jgi:hypothetical protein